ncbi:MAG: ABC transporter ATP-binding protein [Dehalococcoidia bacterium]|jgi:putative ABC transport system ATP-binding protein|nr:ABC transporter ATP-binding protein [Dehalococcoidia bacterium]
MTTSMEEERVAQPTTGEAEDLIVRATDVAKTYDTGRIKVRALRGINLSVKRAEIIAIMGPSGCGKTTLLNCLSGLDSIDFGTILVDGSDINRLSDNQKTDFRARRMGFVFQFYNLLPVLSAIENVELPLLVSGTSAREARKRAYAALEQVHLTEWADHRPAELSGGQRQRVTVARALVNDPAIVWGDEPTGDLDSTNAQEIMDLVCDLNRNGGQTFVLVTHDAKIAARANRVVYMVDGLIVDEKINTDNLCQPQDQA